MTPLWAARTYAGRGWPVFPVVAHGPARKRPMLKDWPHLATADPTIVTDWWRRWPDALIGAPTGPASGLIVLDIDVKNDRANGYDTLEILGRSILPDTSFAHTPSGGLHVYFAAIDREIRNSVGDKGLGPGLDVRGEGGYIIFPSEGAGYWWDPHYNPDTVPLMPAPLWLGHRQRKVRQATDQGRRLKPQAILADACEAIRRAAAGERHDVLNREVFIVAALVKAGALNEGDARHQLQAAVAIMAWGGRADRRKAERDFEDAWRDGLAKGRAA